jgi:hypothetical protein
MQKVSVMYKAALIAILCFSACAVATATSGSGGSAASSSGGGSSGGGSHAGGSSSGGGGSHGAGGSHAGGSHNGARDSPFNVDGARAGSGFADAAARTPGVSVTRETVAGRQATVASYKMHQPISKAERGHLHRAGFFERLNESNGLDIIFCRDSYFLLQSNVTDCFRLVNAR